MRKFLLYSSVGDLSKFPKYWLSGKGRNFDIWISFYGDRTDHGFEKHVDKYFVNRNYKFPNFYDVYKKHYDIIKKYDAVFLIDDDIIIKTQQIRLLFQIIMELDLWVMQPAFNDKSLMYWETNRQISNSFMHYTNFVEINTPIFSKYALEKFMAVYDPELLSTGIDFWCTRTLGIDVKDKYAVIDAITCENPTNLKKTGTETKNREIHKYISETTKFNSWDIVSKKHGIEKFVPKIYKTVPIDNLKNMIPENTKLFSKIMRQFERNTQQSDI